MLVCTRCPGCDTPHAWVVTRDLPPPGDQVAHFLVPAGRMWDDVVHTCGHQRLFCATACVQTWLTRTGNTAGYVMDLPTLWRLAAHCAASSVRSIKIDRCPLDLGVWAAGTAMGRRGDGGWSDAAMGSRRCPGQYR